MRIALVNYRYFFSGGPERYMFNIKEILEKKGHQVIPFSVQHKKNAFTEYEKYFLSPIGKGDEVYFGDYNKKSLRNNIKGLFRMIYSFEAKKKFKIFLKVTKPDIIYILYFQNKISCSIIDAANSLNIPIVQRISDFSLICPNGSFYRQDVNNICELCIDKNKWSSVKHKCVYNSYTYSFIKLSALKVQEFINIKNKIRKFIFPSTFTLNLFVKSGFPREKLIHIPTLFNTNTIRKDLNIEYEKFALYIGRIVPEKGVRTLIDAFINSDYNLKIIGFSDDNYENELKKYIADKNHKIEFLGRMDFYEIQEYLSKCLFTIIPSEWYDNLPNTILESYAFRKCIIATNIGSLSENVINNESGLLFEYKNSVDLRNNIEKLFNNPKKAEEMGKNGYQMIKSKYDEESHYHELINTFQSIINEK